MNLAFAVFNSVVGIKSQSAWYITLSVYYTLLSIMRYWAVNYERRISKAEQNKKLILMELAVYRNCSILFLVMTAALGGMVILTLRSQGGGIIRDIPFMLLHSMRLSKFRLRSQAG